LELPADVEEDAEEDTLEELLVVPVEEELLTLDDKEEE